MRGFRRLQGEKYIYVLAKTVQQARYRGCKPGEIPKNLQKVPPANRPAPRTYQQVTEVFPFPVDSYALNPNIWWAFTGREMPEDRAIREFKVRYDREEEGIRLIRIYAEDTPYPGKLNYLQYHFLAPDFGSDIMVRHRIWTTSAVARSREIMARFNRSEDRVAALFEQAKQQARSESRPMRAYSSRRVKRGIKLKNILQLLVVLIFSALILGGAWQVYSAVQDGRIKLFEDDGAAPASTAQPGAGSETWTPQVVQATEETAASAPEPTAVQAEPPAAAPPAVGGGSPPTQIQMRTRLPVQVALKTSSGRDIVVSLVVYLDGDRIKGDMLVGGTAVPIDKRIRESDDQNSEEFFLYLPPDSGTPNPTRLGYFQVARSENRATVFFTVAPE